jgi:hypothetical protein
MKGMEADAGKCALELHAMLQELMVPPPPPQPQGQQAIREKFARSRFFRVSTLAVRDFLFIFMCLYVLSFWCSFLLLLLLENRNLYGFISFLA